MLAAIETAFADTGATDLTFVLGLPPLDSLAVLPVELDGGPFEARIELRLLGASHQAILTGPQGSCSETVACLPDLDGRLPTSVSERIGGLAYDFSATVERLRPAGFRRRIDALTRGVQAHPTALAGTYPGSPLAVTALVAERGPAGEVGWRTWHTYPRDGEIVATRTRVTTVARRS